MGRYCEWKPEDGADLTGQWDSFDEFFSNLVLECDPEGSAGILEWTPDVDTPDLVYYQVHFFHLILFRDVFDVVNVLQFFDYIRHQSNNLNKMHCMFLHIWDRQWIVSHSVSF